MSLPIIVVGAGGRMGRTICGLVQQMEDLVLCGMVDRPGCCPVAPEGCTAGSDVETVLAAAPEGAVTIDFSSPESSLKSARAAAARGTGLVIGTTGHDAAQKEELAALAAKAPIFLSPNMSVGVSVLQKILPLLAKDLGGDYDMEIVEIHHNRKKDSPSGTALRLGEAIAEARGWKLEDVRCSARDGIIGPRPKVQVGIQAVRGGDVVGVHTVYFFGPGECIEVTHRAESRENFARGAIRAARWLALQPAGRLYGMADMF